MDNQKIENQLNLSLDANAEERTKSQDLNVGYDPNINTWELIVKYHGDLETAAGSLIAVEILLEGYAIAIVPEYLIESFAALEEVEYIEKPKSLYFSVLDAKQQACISSLQTGNDGLTGKGVAVCIVDSGLDIYHPDFRNEDGTTRLLFLWDQITNDVYDTDEINELLENEEIEKRTFDISGHGTNVAGIAVGNGRASEGRYRGVAYEASIIAVRLGNPEPNAFPRTTQLMRAVSFAFQRAVELQMPLAVNISFGNNYGSHSGFSLLEQFLNDISDIGRAVIVTGTGNEGIGRGHTGGTIASGNMQEKELAVGEYQYSFSIQVWKSYSDDIEIAIVHPSGQRVGLIGTQIGAYRYQLGSTQILVYYGEPSPYSLYQEIYIELIPRGDYVDAGIWSFNLFASNIKNGNYSIWLPSMSTLSAGTGFLLPTEEYTLTIPSTAQRLISVGAYNGKANQPADFSGRGYTWQTNQIKPELIAPGVDITTTAVDGGYATVSGTSFAAPFVTGAAALMMEYGIVKGNDMYLYGEKLKAYLIKGAKRMSGISELPNQLSGWGLLCLRDSLPL